jgi:parvulin-like peptidyl-prolyl isomerase
MAKKPSKKETSTNWKAVARSKQDRKQQKRLRFAIIGFTALIVLIIGYGILDQFVFLQAKPVAIVDGEKIPVNQFQKEVRYNRYQAVGNYNSYLQIYQLFQGDENFAAQFQTQLVTISSQLAPANAAVFGKSVLEGMINAKLIESQAAEMGFTVSDAEIEERLQTIFGYYPNGEPTPAPTTEPYVASTLSPEQMAIVTVTPTPTELPPTATPTQMAGPAVEQTPTATSEPQPTATPVTEEGYNTLVEDYLAELNDAGVNFTRDDLKHIVFIQMLNEQIIDEIAGDVATEEEQVWARHILVPDKTTADIVYAQLMDGADFAEIAAELSTDTSNKNRGGDLGWFGRNIMDPAFEEAAYALEIGEISEPVESNFGWHIIQTLGKEVRPLDQNMIDSRRQEVYNAWLDEVKAGSEIEIFEDRVKDFAPTEPGLEQQQPY